MAVRIDKWLWSVRAFKTRTQASAACDDGHVSPRRDPDEDRSESRRGTGESGHQRSASEGTDEGRDERGDRESRPRRRRGGRGRSGEATGERSAERSGEGSGERLPATEAEIIPLEERRPSAEALAASKRMPKRDRSQLDDSKPLPPRPQPVAAQPHAEEHKPESGNPDSAQPAVAAAAPVSAVAGGDAVDSHAESAPQAETASRSETVMQPPQLEVDTRPESVEPVMAQAAAAEEAVEADEAPEAAVPEPETGSDIDDAQAQEAAAADAGGAPKRAYNDPREVRRRAREAQLKAQGVMPRAGDQS